MQDGRYPKRAYNGYMYVHGVRNRGSGRPKKRWIDMIKEDSKQGRPSL